ncbi:MAG TPA: transketolase, partial [Alphaproteobacteria bacterium]|nr:transketolase [Alphaproteobacteria bacterium]
MANAIRALVMDAVEQANSGHPGMPMGMADVATVLFTRYYKFDPADPAWPDRDRFVLSAGHGSMLLYAVLHLLGVKEMTMDELRRFRQLDSRTAGHPEYGHAPGIETTTGPLGQGFATAVGMALAERHLATRFGSDLVDHYTYVIAGDGCLMDGISHEAASLAGHLKLNKLIVLFDDNHISIDGPTDLSVSDDVHGRFKAYGWATQAVDGHDPAAVARAIETARASDRPTLIACRTTIGYGAPTKAGTAGTHGSPLGATEIAGAREKLGWPYAAFTVPEAINTAWRSAGARNADARRAWHARLDVAPKEKRAALLAALSGDLPKSVETAVNTFKKTISDTKPSWATRKASQEVLEVITPLVPEMVGGSADLTGSNNTKSKVEAILTPNSYGGRYIHYGVREHGMAAAMNGLALHGGIIPYGGTFLVFTDYCRPAIRLSALMRLRVIYVMTHDSIGLGEDGPTHQPIEHLASLRAMPNLAVYRPADAVETAECWLLALQDRTRPSILALTRQNVATLRVAHTDENLSARGAYVLREAEGKPRTVTLIATGSEVEIAVKARDLLAAKNIGAAVVSMPSWERFAAQDEAYRRSVVNPDTVRVSIEAASPFGWEQQVGTDGRGAAIGISSFGASAPAPELYKHFGITAEAMA